MSHSWKSTYYFYYFYSYLNPGFLPLFLPHTTSLFCTKNENTFTPSLESYQKWLHGESAEKPTYPEQTEHLHFVSASIKENYQFVRTFFGFPYCILIWILRVCKQPARISELRHLFPLIQKKQFQPAHTPHHLPAIQINENITVSVIIPTKNRYAYLIPLLNQLNRQSYVPQEVIIVDQSQPNQHLQQDKYRFNLIHLLQNGSGQARAKNTGIEAATGDYILLLDDDVLVDENLIEEHLKCILFQGADISTGPYTKPSKFIRKYTAFSIAAHMPAGNCLIKKSVFQEVGKFNLVYDQLPIEDTDFYCRCKSLNKIIMLNHAAGIQHFEASEGGMRYRFIRRIPAVENLRWLHPDVIRFYRKILPHELVIRMLVLMNIRYFLKSVKSMWALLTCLIHLAILPYYVYKVHLISKT